MECEDLELELARNRITAVDEFPFHSQVYERHGELGIVKSVESYIHR